MLVLWNEKLRHIAKERGLKLAALARSSGMAPQTLRTALSRRQNVSAGRGLALARALGVSAEWLFDPQQGLDALSPSEGQDVAVSVADMGATLRRIESTLKAMRLEQILAETVAELRERKTAPRRRVGGTKKRA